VGDSHKSGQLDRTMVIILITQLVSVLIIL